MIQNTNNAHLFVIEIWNKLCAHIFFEIQILDRNTRNVSNSYIVLFLGEFPIEIKTKIIYHIIFVILILPYEIMMTTNCMISYFSFDFDRKSTYCYCVKTLLSKIKQHYARINLSEISTFFKIYCIQQMWLQ